MPIADLTKDEIKKRPVPTLTERWWKTAWTGEKPSAYDRPMLAGIKALKEAQRGKSQSDLIDRLNALKDLSKKLRDAANKMPQLNRKLVMSRELLAFDSLCDAELKKARKFGSGTRKVFSYNLGDRVLTALKGHEAAKMLKLASTGVEIELLEAMVQEIDARNAMNALFAGYSNALDDAVDAIVKDLKTLAKSAGDDDASTMTHFAGNVFDRHAKLLADIHHKVPTDVLKKLGLNAEMEKQYQKDLKSRRKAIAKSTVMTVAAGAAIALPGTQAFAIYGFARSTAGLAQQLVEHNMKITTAAKLLEGHLAYLSKAFSKASKGVGRAASETGGTTLNAVLGIDLVPTLDKSKSAYKDLKTNTGHAGFKTQKLIDEVMKAMDSAKPLRKAADALPAGKRKKELEARAAKAEGKLDELLKKTIKLGADLNKVERRLPRLGKILAALGDNTKAQDFANYSAKLLVNLTGIAGGGLVDATAACTAANAVVKSGEAVLAMSIASAGYIDELKSTYDNAKALAD